MLFYYQNKIVGVKTEYFMEIRVGETEEIYIREDNDYEYIKYDKVEIASTAASNF